MLHLVNLILNDSRGEDTIGHNGQFLEQTFLQVLGADHMLLNLQTTFNEAFKHLRVRELLQDIIQRTLNMLREVG